MTQRHAAKTKLRAAIYCRISSDREGRELGVERQQKDCRALAARLKLTVVEVYIDNDLSASTKAKKSRPDYQRMLRDARAGEFDIIISYTSARITRKPRENEDLIDLAVEHGIRYEYVRSPSFDLNTADGRRIARTLAAHDAGEAEKIAELVLRAKEETALAGGYRGGRRPFGYTDDGMTIIEVEKAVVVDAAEAILTGVSLNAVCRDLNERGIPTSTGGKWTGRALARLMVRPRNVGLIDRHGEILGKAQWPPLLDEATWRAVVAFLQDPARRTNGGAPERWLLSGLATCGKCGAHIHRGSAPIRGGQKLGMRPVYQCSRRREVARDARQLDDFIVSLVIERLSRPDAAKLLQAPEREAVDVKKLHGEALELRGRKDELTDLWLRKAIDTRQLERGQQQLDADLAAIEAQLADAGRRSVLAGVIGGDVEETWDGLPFERQRAIIAHLLKITLMPARRGRVPGWRAGESYFAPDSVEISWLR